MTIEILDAGSNGTCYIDSVTDIVFGTLMEDLEEAESFMKCHVDLRNLGSKQFDEELSKFRKSREISEC